MNINRDPLCSQIHLPLNLGFKCISYKHRSTLDHGLYVLFAKEGFFFTCHTPIRFKNNHWYDSSGVMASFYWEVAGGFPDFGFRIPRQKPKLCCSPQWLVSNPHLWVGREDDLRKLLAIPLKWPLEHVATWCQFEMVIWGRESLVSRYTRSRI